MKIISKPQVELIDAVLAEVGDSGINAAILEKDIHVTEMLHALCALQHPYLSLVFCGGTSLSKAHGLIERMSEDVDLKVVLKEGHELSRSKIRSALKELRVLAIEDMTRLGYVQDTSGTKVLNEGRYVATSWFYEPQYATDGSLRPHLSLEFTFRAPEFPTISLPVGYLVNRLSKLDGALSTIDCVAVEEILAEKVLSFLRRHAQHRSGNMQQEWDSALVRHIYDTYCIVQSDPTVVARAKQYFPELVKFDTKEFDRHTEFVQDPKSCMEIALATAETEAQTITEYQTRLLPLVYGQTKPSYQDAFIVFKTCAQELLSVL
jgi:predicted nucleotidyltransferase component of viral defense system